MNLLYRPRLWMYAVASAALLTVLWLVLVPVTTEYVTSDTTPTPRHVATRYSWWTTEQDLVYSDTGPGQRPHFVNGIRLDCSNLLRNGNHELAQAPAGPQGCAETESPRLVAALALFAVGLLALLAMPMVPSVSERYRNSYHQPYSQRRALKRSR